MSTGIARMPKTDNHNQPESQVVPDPSLEKRKRRVHSLEYKMRILAEADNCKHGELGVMLRREKLYAGQLKTWRDELNDDGTNKLSKTKPGPVAKQSAESKQIEKLSAQVKRLQRELDISNGCIDLQKKALSLLNLQSSGKKP